MSKIFDIFGNRFVTFVFKSVKGLHTMHDGSKVEGNAVSEGFLLDEDDFFFYTGTTSDQIDEALLKDDVVRIFVANEEEEVHPLLAEAEDGNLN